MQEKATPGVVWCLADRWKWKRPSAVSVAWVKNGFAPVKRIIGALQELFFSLFCPFFLPYHHFLHLTFSPNYTKVGSSTRQCGLQPWELCNFFCNILTFYRSCFRKPVLKTMLVHACVREWVNEWMKTNNTGFVRLLAATLFYCLCECMTVGMPPCSLNKVCLHTVVVGSEAEGLLNLVWQQPSAEQEACHQHEQKVTHVNLRARGWPEEHLTCVVLGAGDRIGQCDHVTSNVEVSDKVDNKHQFRANFGCNSQWDWSVPTIIFIQSRVGGDRADTSVLVFQNSDVSSRQIPTTLIICTNQRAFCW